MTLMEFESAVARYVNQIETFERETADHWRETFDNLFLGHRGEAPVSYNSIRRGPRLLYIDGEVVLRSEIPSQSVLQVIARDIEGFRSAVIDALQLELDCKRVWEDVVLSCNGVQDPF